MSGFAFLMSGCNGTILDGVSADGTGSFTDSEPSSGIGTFTSIQFEADVVGKFWPTTTIDEFLTTGTLPTLASGYNPKMIFNLEKGLKKTLGTTLMATALASINGGDTSIGAIPVSVKFTTGHMKWTFTLGDAVINSAWATGILIDENGKASFITGKLQDTASILETQTGDIIIAGGKSANAAVNWVGVLPSGGTAIASSEDGQTDSPIRLKKKDAKPYLMYLFSAPVLGLVNQTYNAGSTLIHSNLSTVASTQTILIIHAKSDATITPWSNWGVVGLHTGMNAIQYMTAYQPGDSSNSPANWIICDSSYNTATTEYEGYSCINSGDDTKDDIISDGDATTYDDLIGNAGSSIWDPSNLFTPNYPIPSNQTDTIKLEAM